MKDKMRVDIEMVRSLKEALGVINRTNIKDIQFYKNGKQMKMKNIEEFRSTGLSNVDYVMLEFWKSPKLTFSKTGKKK
jgi:hypothetical protein